MAARAGITGVGQIAVNVKEIDRALAFYRDVLGLAFLFEVPKMAFFDCGGVRLMLAVAEEAQFDHPASIIYYRVDDIRQSHQELSARGAKFEGEPHRVAPMPDHDLWMAFLRDPDGNLLALMSEVPRRSE